MLITLILEMDWFTEQRLPRFRALSIGLPSMVDLIAASPYVVGRVDQPPQSTLCRLELSAPYEWSALRSFGADDASLLSTRA